MNVVINYWAVLLSAVVSMVIGSIWFGPLFGKKFMEACDMDKWSPEKQAEMKKSMMVSYVGQFIASLVSFYALAWLVSALGYTTVMGGVAVAMLIFIGFMVPHKLGDALWGGKAVLFWLGVGSSFFIMLAGGAILGGWH